MRLPVILRPLPLRIGTKVFYERRELVADVFSWNIRRYRWALRDALSRVPGLSVHQHGWTFGKRRFLEVSVDRRMRAARWSTEYHRPVADEPYRFWNVCWASPTNHRWWARSIHLYWR